MLLLTPDFPPDRGGIQRLVHGLVCHLPEIRSRLVTCAAMSSEPVAVPPECEVRRGRRWPGRALALTSLNVHSIGQALAFRPNVTFCAHIVASPAAWVIAVLLGTPYVLYVHGKELMRRPRLARFACRHATAVLANSRYTRDLVLPYLSSSTPALVVPPGVEPAPRRDPPAGPPTILTVARLDDRYKGHDVLLRALPLVRARVPDARLVIVGGGSLLPVYQAIAGALGVREATQFCGAVDDAALERCFRAAHVFALVSRITPNGAEGFGIVYLEAGIRGIPAVAGNAAGAKDAVEDEVNGLLVDPEDHVAVADALCRLLVDPGHATALGRAGAERAQRYVWPAIAASVGDALTRAALARRP